MNYSLALFDADDTLFDFRGGARLSFRATMAEHGLSEHHERLWPSFSEISAGLWQLVEQGTFDKTTLNFERFARLFKTHRLETDPVMVSDFYQEQLCLQTRLLPGALELCRHLRGKARIAIVTNGIEAVQKRRLAASEIREYVDVMVVSEECGFAKPDVRIFQHTLERLGHTDFSRVLMIGDRLETDVLGARRAGLKSCWYNPERATRTGDITPDHEVHHLDEIQTLFS